MNSLFSAFQIPHKLLTSTIVIGLAGLLIGLFQWPLGLGIVLGSISTLLASSYNPAPKSQPIMPGNPQQTVSVSTTTDDQNDDMPVNSNPDIKTLFVGNLAFKANRHELNKLFSQHGQVHSVRLMTDRVTRKPRGFGFVEMAAKDAAAAIEALNDFEFFGRQLRVNEANERKAKADE